MPLWQIPSHRSPHPKVKKIMVENHLPVSGSSIIPWPPATDDLTCHSHRHHLPTSASCPSFGFDHAKMRIAVGKILEASSSAWDMYHENMEPAGQMPASLRSTSSNLSSQFLFMNPLTPMAALRQAATVASRIKPDTPSHSGFLSTYPADNGSAAFDTPPQLGSRGPLSPHLLVPNMTFPKQPTLVLFNISIVLIVPCITALHRGALLKKTTQIFLRMKLGPTFVKESKRIRLTSLGKRKGSDNENTKGKMLFALWNFSEGRKGLEIPIGMEEMKGLEESPSKTFVHFELWMRQGGLLPQSGSRDQLVADMSINLAELIPNEARQHRIDFGFGLLTTTAKFVKPIQSSFSATNTIWKHPLLNSPPISFDDFSRLFQNDKAGCSNSDDSILNMSMYKFP